MHMWILKKIQIFYLCNLFSYQQNFHNIYIGGEHKTRVMQINSKNNYFKNIYKKIKK
jgi:hypothetical protein